MKTNEYEDTHTRATKDDAEGRRTTEGRKTRNMYRNKLLRKVQPNV